MLPDKTSYSEQMHVSHENFGLHTEKAVTRAYCRDSMAQQIKRRSVQCHKWVTWDVIFIELRASVTSWYCCNCFILTPVSAGVAVFCWADMLCDMLLKFRNEAYVDMYFICGFCSGNCRDAAMEHQLHVEIVFRTCTEWTNWATKT